MNLLLPERKTAQMIIANFMFIQRTESTERGQPEIKSLHVICSTVVFFVRGEAGMNKEHIIMYRWIRKDLQIAVALNNWTSK